MLTGLEVEAKAAWVREQLVLDPAPETVVWSPVVAPALDAATEESASALLRCTVQDPSAEVVGRAFTAAAVELALASYPGFTLTAPPGPATPYGIYRAEYVDRSAVTHTVVHADGRREVVADPPTAPHPGDDRTGTRPSPYPHPTDTLTRRMPLGTFVHARSGDKGGDANLGLWVTHADPARRPARVEWLSKLITPQKVRELVPEAADLEVEVFLLPNLGGVNVVLHGLLGRGVAASTRFDPQAKGLGEWVRSRLVSIEEGLLVMSHHRDALRDHGARARTPRGRPPPRRLGGGRRGAARRCTGRQPRRGCSASRSRRRSAARAATCSTASRVMEGCFEAGASSGLMAALFTGGIALPHLAASGDADLVDQVRAADARRRADREPRGHRARRRLRRRRAPHHGRARR